jgi:[ribosomal protein S5]-alanine N-acetyltransferase
VIETSRSLLRPMRDDDAEALLAVFSDPLAMASFGVPPFSDPQMEAWVRRNLDHQAEHGYGLFTVVHKADNLVIGDCGLERMDVEGEAAAELSYDLRSDYWNGGLATEAATAVRDYAFDVLQLPRLISLIWVGNHASRRVTEKAGMQQHSTLMRGDRPYWLYRIDRPASP